MHPYSLSHFYPLVSVISSQPILLTHLEGLLKRKYLFTVLCWNKAVLIVQFCINHYENLGL